MEEETKEEEQFALSGRPSMRGTLTECFGSTDHRLQPETITSDSESEPYMPSLPPGDHCQKCGVVKYIEGDYEPNCTWKKSFLLLLKRPYRLEFQSFGKEGRPEDYGVFCRNIVEPLQTTEFYPKHTFILKYEGRVAYVVQTKDDKELNSWLTVIRASKAKSLRRETTTKEARLAQELEQNDTDFSRSTGIKILITPPSDDEDYILAS